jgi:hypothetical protein
VSGLTAESFPPGTAVESLAFEPGSKLFELREATLRHCTSLKAICIPSSVRTLESFCCRGSLWRGCSSTANSVPLQLIIFKAESQLRQIPPFGFPGSPILKSLTLPASLKLVSGSKLPDQLLSMAVNQSVRENSAQIAKLARLKDMRFPAVTNLRQSAFHRQ